MSASIRDVAAQSAPRQQLLTIPAQVWRWFKGKWGLGRALSTAQPAADASDASREDVLQALAEMMYDDLMDGDVDVDDYFRTALDDHMSVCSEDEFYVVLALAHCCLAEDIDRIIWAGKNSEPGGINLDRAERSIELFRKLDEYSTTLTLERFCGRVADPAVVHLTSGTH